MEMAKASTDSLGAYSSAAPAVGIFPPGSVVKRRRLEVAVLLPKEVLEEVKDSKAIP